MTDDRAIEILNPEHREQYESIEPVNEACRMGMEALKAMKYPLLAWLKEEVPFRLIEILGVSDAEMEKVPCDELAKELFDNSDAIFDYDAIDAIITQFLDDNGIEHGEG